jgi:hypothetical protein
LGYFRRFLLLRTTTNQKHTDGEQEQRTSPSNKSRVDKALVLSGVAHGSDPERDEGKKPKRTLPIAKVDSKHQDSSTTHRPEGEEPGAFVRQTRPRQ